MYPPELLYTKEHEWIRLDGDEGTIGVTDHAQKELGDVVYVELPKPGDQVVAHQSFGTVESVKAVSDIYAPVSGEVAGVNRKLQDKPELVNSDPHGEGWLIRIRLEDRAEAEGLMTADQYEAYLAGQAGAAGGKS